MPRKAKGDTPPKRRFKPVKARSANQANYIEAMQRSDVVFGVGPAGTGKTYLAIAAALEAYRAAEIEKIILTRPAVEAGENLGYLPGDLEEKIAPYLRPLFDALNEIAGCERIRRMEQDRVFEIAPLAFMRGRTLNNAYIIVDEAQNTTQSQMKMILTRVGENSKIVVTGDISQHDLPRGVKSGLVEAVEILKGINGIEFVEFTDEDVVRHPLVAKIVLAYDTMERQEIKNGV